MKKSNVLELRSKISHIWKWVFLESNQKPATRGYLRLNTSECGEKMRVTRIGNWVRCLSRSRPLVAQTPLGPKAVAVPKGQMAVYVGQRGDASCRFLVPVIYVNHPLFADLLAKTEEEYGCHQSGAITIPCRVSEFESMQTRIAAEMGRKLRRRLCISYSLRAFD